MASLNSGLPYLTMALMTPGSMWLIDRVGRRPPWLVASLLMAVITAATGLVFHFQVYGALLLLVLVLCTVPHGLALGPLPWLMMSEGACVGLCGLPHS